jgi:hypothetical protein
MAEKSAVKDDAEIAAAVVVEVPLAAVVAVVLVVDLLLQPTIPMTVVAATATRAARGNEWCMLSLP